MVAIFKSNAMYKGRHDELFGTYANSTLWQNYQTITSSVILPQFATQLGRVFGGPIFNPMPILQLLMI